MFGWKRSKREEYYKKKSHLISRLNKDVIRDGTAYLSCKIEGLDDVLSKFSVNGIEALNGEFKDEFLSFVDCIPQEYPLVLEIHGPQFTEEEKKMITEAVNSDADYLLGKTEADNRHHRKVFWLFADALVRYLFIEFRDYKNEKIQAGRIASMKVEFVEA